VVSGDQRLPSQADPHLPWTDTYLYLSRQTTCPSMSLAENSCMERAQRQSSRDAHFKAKGVEWRPAPGSPGRKGSRAD
jgi:hypothetical protein